MCLENLRTRFRCTFRGHDPTWEAGFLSPTWTCKRCGKEGDLHDHTKMSLSGHLFGIIPVAIVIVVIWFLLR